MHSDSVSEGRHYVLAQAVQLAIRSPVDDAPTHLWSLHPVDEDSVPNARIALPLMLLI